MKEMSLASVIQIFVLTLSLVVFSCTPEGEGILNTQSSIADTVDNYTKQAPFAYDIAADTISYNSCVNYVADSGSASNPVPSLTVGVNEGFVTTNGNGAVKGGLKLRTAFLQYVGRYFKPEAPSSTITPEQVQRILQNSTANKGAYMQFSIRKKTDLTLNVDLISPGTNDINSIIPQPQRDAILFLQDITSGFVGNSLTKDIKFTGTGTVLAEGPRTYNLSDTPDPVPIQGSFGLNQTADKTLLIPTDSTNTNPETKFGVAEYYADTVRKKFNSTGNDRVILTAVFGGKALDAAPGTQPTTDETISQIRRQTSDVSKAFGRGYSLKFEPKVRNVAGWVSNVLSGTAVTEFDLSTGTTVQGAQWTCENFVIVLPAHYDNKRLTEPTCSPLISTDMTEARQLAVKKIRRQHLSTDWNIGLFIPKDTALGVTAADRIANRANYQICVSPRRSNCYLPTTQIFSEAGNAGKDAGIQYDTSQECYLTAFNLMGANYTNAATPDAKRLLGRCANYLSVCTRSSTNF